VAEGGMAGDDMAAEELTKDGSDIGLADDWPQC
jgi:hypothetical protein